MIKQFKIHKSWFKDEKVAQLTRITYSPLKTVIFWRLNLRPFFKIFVNFFLNMIIINVETCQTIHVVNRNIV